MSFVTIQTAIYTIINAVKATHGIDTVYKYPVTEVGVTPIVTVELAPSGEEFEDTAENSLTANWVVRIIVERTNSDSTQYAKILDLLDDVLGVLRDDDNATLSGAVYKVLPLNHSPIYPAQYGDVKVWAVDILLETKTCKTL